MQSPNGFKEFLPGLKEGGDVTIEGNWIPDNPTQDKTTGLLGEFFNDTPGHFILVFPDTGSPDVQWEFDAVMTGFDTSMPVENRMTFTAVLKISGEPTLH
jgi:hypothetical protein